MSKRCPECHRVNEDTKIFCTYCGATLDAHLRLIQDLERQKELSKEPETAKQRGDVNFYVSRSAPKKKKKSAAPWIILGLIVLAAAAWFFLH